MCGWVLTWEKNNGDLSVSFQTTSESQAIFFIALVQVFACVSCDLTTALSVYFHALTPEIIEKLPANLINEWQEFFSEGIHSLLLPLMVKITSKFLPKDKCANWHSMESIICYPQCPVIYFNHIFFCFISMKLTPQN